MIIKPILLLLFIFPILIDANHNNIEGQQYFLRVTGQLVCNDFESLIVDEPYFNAIVELWHHHPVVFGEPIQPDELLASSNTTWNGTFLIEYNHSQHQEEALFSLVIKHGCASGNGFRYGLCWLENRFILLDSKMTNDGASSKGGQQYFWDVGQLTLGSNPEMRDFDTWLYKTDQVCPGIGRWDAELDHGG